MTKLFDLFPQELKDQVVDYTIKQQKSSKKLPTRPTRPNKINSKSVISIDFAYPRVKKLPLTTERQVKSAINHFYNVAKVTEDERSEAFKKILCKAELFKICTIVLKDKYSQYL